MSEEKFSKCEEGKKNVSVEFRVFGKKMEIKRKVPGKKIKVFAVEIKVKVEKKMFGSCVIPLVGRHVD